MNGQAARAMAAAGWRLAALAARVAVVVLAAAAGGLPAAAAGAEPLPPEAAAALAAAGWTAREEAGATVLARDGLELRAVAVRAKPATRGGVALRLERVQAGAAPDAPDRGRMTARRLFLSDAALLALAGAVATDAPCGGLPLRPVSASFWDLDLLADADALPPALAGPERLTAARATLTLQAEPWRQGCRIDLILDVEDAALAAAGGAAARIGRIALRLSGTFAPEAPVVVTLLAEGVDLRRPGDAPLLAAARLRLEIDADAAAAGALAAEAPWQRLAASRLAVGLAVEGLATDAALWLDRAPANPAAPGFGRDRRPPPAAAAAPPAHPLAGDLSLALGLAGARLSVAATADLAGALTLDAGLEATLGAGGGLALPGFELPPALAGARLDGARLAWVDRGLDALVAPRAGGGLQAQIAAAEAAVLARAPAPAWAMLAALTGPAAAFLAGGLDGPVAVRLAPGRPVTVAALMRTLVLAPGELGRLLGVETATAALAPAPVTPP